MSQRRVLQVVASSRGGGAELVRCLVSELDTNRYLSTVVMPDDGGQVGAADFEALSVRCVRLDIASGFRLREWLRLRRYLRVGRFDIIHSHGSRAAFWARLATISDERPKNVVGIHGLAIVHSRGARRLVQLALERGLQRLTDAVICDSEAERNDVLQHRLSRAERTYTVHSGIQVDRFDRGRYDSGCARVALGLERDRPVIATVCRLHRPRDFSTLLLATRSVAEQLPDVTLLIAGDGPLRSKIEQAVQALRLTAQVRLLGAVCDVADVLAAADVFVLSTKGWEGLPLAPLEAMAMRLPVIISDVGGNRIAVEHGVTGLVVPPAKPGPLAEAMVRLLSDRQAAAAMGERGRERVTRLFTARRMAEQTMMVYDQVCADQRLGPEPR